MSKVHSETIGSRTDWEVYSEGSAMQFEAGELQLGPMTSFGLLHDPKHMCLVLARYKFCGKMLEGKKEVLEIGCGDGFGTPILAQFVEHLHCIDWDIRHIEGNRRRLAGIENTTFEQLNMNKEAPKGKYEAAVWLDVIEHLDPKKEGAFVQNIVSCLKPEGILITGTPNITAAKYSSEWSRRQHINLHSHQSLKALMKDYFANVFMFGMNDEVVHTGFPEMAHYIFSLAVGLRD